jgi:hydrogenase maturation protease
MPQPGLAEEIGFGPFPAAAAGESAELAGLVGHADAELPFAAAASGPAPVLILAIGNRLLTDDGVGIEILSRLEPLSREWGEAVELIDGGTCGLALLGAVLDRAAVVFLDAVKLGAEPGSVHVLRKGDLLGMSGRESSAHEGGAKQILAALALLGETPQEVTVVGVEPASVATGIGLSEVVEARLGEAVNRVRQVVAEIIQAGR